MSLAYVSSPGLPGMRPRNFSGDGTDADAGMWSTSSVVTRESVRYSLISFVYSSSCFCGAWFFVSEANAGSIAAVRAAATVRPLSLFKWSLVIIYPLYKIKYCGFQPGNQVESCDRAVMPCIVAQ